MHNPCWTRLVRFIAAETNQEHYGEPFCSASEDVGALFQAGKLKAKLLIDDPLSSRCTFASPERILSVKRLLPPVNVPAYGASIRCLGTNYPLGGAKKPLYPILFYKPYTCLAGYGDPIFVPKEVQDESDYEVELVIVIGKECRDVTPEQAHDYIVGYTLCNDVTARKRMFATPQWGMGKSFDGWLPLGPCLVSSAVLPFEKAQDTLLRTTMETTRTLKHSSHQNPLQNGSTKDQLWKIAETVSALSYGTTLKVGDIICTGTPAGQGSSKQPEPLWLNDGDKITVFGEGGLGSMMNPVVWEKSGQKGALKARL